MKRNKTLASFEAVVLVSATAVALKANDDGDTGSFKFKPNSLVLSRSVYVGDANTV